MRKIIIIVIALAIVLGFVFWKFAPNFSDRSIDNVPITINITGLWEEENLIKPAIEAYKKDHPNVTINYKYESSRNYRNRVEFQTREGNGPDIFLIHNSWLPMFLKENLLAEMPEKIMSFDDYSKDFYPVVKDSMAKDGKIYAIPRGVDGLAMYVNMNLLKNAGITQVPGNWVDFVSAASRVTVVDGNGSIVTAGAAMGTAGNVDHWSDILGLLFVQQFALRRNTSLEAPDTPGGAEVLKFYTDFAKGEKKVWDASLESSTEAFKREKVAFYFAPSWRAHELRASNPSLDFQIVPVPQLPGTENNPVGWGTFWGYAVSGKSAVKDEAWAFLKYFTSAEIQKLLYQEAVKVRLFGLPYSKVELQSELINDPLVGAFVKQAPRYRWWYLNSNTFDNNGINEQMIKYYEDAVNATLAGSDPLSALQTTSKGVQQVLETFKPVSFGQGIN